MRVSIWQQFSSNHSGFFDIVGEFESHESASKAAQELQQFVRFAQEQYYAPQNAQLLEFVWKNEYHIPATTVEHEIATQFDIEIDRAMTWVPRVDADEFISRTVVIFEEIVFMDNGGGRTWSGKMPFDQLMTKSGGNVKSTEYTEEEASRRIHTQIACTAPDERTADCIFQETHIYLEHDTTNRKTKIRHPSPWAPHFSDSDHNTDAAIERFLIYQQAEQEWHKEHDPTLEQLRVQVSNAPDKQQIKQLRQQIAALFQQKHRDLPERDSAGSTAILYTNASGAISRDGASLRFSQVDFMYMKYGFPALITWLKSQHCTDITYTFEYSIST